jgi:hypothetical protein
MAEPVGFGVELTLDRREVFDVVARCEEVVELAERAAQSEIAFMVEGVRRFLLGRLTGSPVASTGNDGSRPQWVGGWFRR